MGDMQPLQVSIKEAAQFLGVCRQTLYRMRDDNEIIVGRIRGRVFVPVAELKRLRPAAEVDRFLRHMMQRKQAKKPAPMIYFIDCGPYTKIGFTTRGAETRLLGLKTSNPFEMRLWGVAPGTAETERALHQFFHDYRHNREWFRFDSEGRDLLLTKLRELNGRVVTGRWKGLDPRNSASMKNKAREVGYGVHR